MNKPLNYAMYIGEVAVSQDMQTIYGLITDVFKEDGILYAVIEEEIEIRIGGSCLCLDVMGSYKKDNPSLPGSFVRLSY